MNRYNYNLEIFHNKDSTFYYILGALLTDGNVYQPNKTKATINLTSRDKDWLELINYLVCPKKPILKHGKNCWRVQYHSLELFNFLKENGCHEKKSLTLQFPNIPDKYLGDFIRGCWDGDGSLSFTKSGNRNTNYQRQANLTSGSLDFITSLHKKLNYLGIKNHIRIHTDANSSRIIEGRTINPKNNSYRLVLSGGQHVYNFCKLIYNQNLLSMPRKYNIAQQIIKEWEKEFFCQKCQDKIIPKTINSRKLQYCSTCLKYHQLERARIRYSNKKIKT